MTTSIEHLISLGKLLCSLYKLLISEKTIGAMCSILFYFIEQVWIVCTSHLIVDIGWWRSAVEKQQIENDVRARRQSINILFSHVFCFSIVFDRCFCLLSDKPRGIFIILIETVDQNENSKKRIEPIEQKYWQTYANLCICARLQRQNRKKPNGIRVLSIVLSKTNDKYYPLHALYSDV